MRAFLWEDVNTLSHPLSSLEAGSLARPNLRHVLATAKLFFARLFLLSSSWYHIRRIFAGRGHSLVANGQKCCRFRRSRLKGEGLLISLCLFLVPNEK